jgi:hypothetical protein
MGCRRRMGQDWRPDRAISNKMLHFILAKAELRLDQAQTAGDVAARRRWIFVGGHIVLCYAQSLRGPEGLPLELGGACVTLQQTTPKIMLCLLCSAPSRANISSESICSPR